MSEEFKLAAEVREAKEKMSAIREVGYTPAVVYGTGHANQSIKVKTGELDKILSQAGETHLVNLAIGNVEPIKVVVYEVQRDPIKGNILHVDFYQVDMKKKVEVEVPLEYVGISKAVDELGGVLSKSADHVKVSCLPGDLPDHLEIDLSRLDTLDSVFKASDLKLPKGVELVNENEETLVSIIELTKQDEAPVVAATEAAPAAATPEKK